ncbi:MAG: MFS transporter [Crinalium sp.]
MLIIANLLMGLSAGCYWTAADAAVIDVTTSEHRHKAFAILVLADSLGGGLGICGGGMLLSIIHQVQFLFFVGSLILMVFLVLIWIAVTETRQEHLENSETLQGFVVAFRDRSLLLFVLVNVQGKRIKIWLNIAIFSCSAMKLSIDRSLWQYKVKWELIAKNGKLSF